MRILKFRVWDKLNKKMIRTPHDSDFNIVIVLPDLIQVHKKSPGMEFIEGDYLGEKFELIEFTGFLDSKGKEIWEGDIVKVWIVGEKDQIGQVVSNDGCFEVIIKYAGRFGRLRDYLKVYVANHAIEVIGNIYEHSNLLGGQG